MELTKKELDIIRKYYDDTNVSSHIFGMDENTLFELLRERFGTTYKFPEPFTTDNGRTYNIGLVFREGMVAGIAEIPCTGCYVAARSIGERDETLYDEVNNFMEARVPSLR